MPFQVNIKGTLKTLTRSSHVTPCGLEHNTRKHASKTTFASVFNPSFHLEFFLSFLNFTVKTFIYTENYIPKKEKVSFMESEQLIRINPLEISRV